MRAKVRKALDVVEDVLLENNLDSQDLWNLMSALRGPDNAESESKRGGTIPIRRAVFPRLTKRYDSYESTDAVPAVFNGPDRPYDNFIDGSSSEHFNQHILHAWQAVDNTDDDGEDADADN